MFVFLYIQKRSLLTMSLDRPSERRNSGFAGFGTDHVHLDDDNHVPTRKSVSTDTSGRLRETLRSQILLEDKKEENEAIQKRFKNTQL